MNSVAITGTESQIEWAQRIKPKVGVEFDRVVRVFETVGAKQREPDRAETQAIVALVREMRNGVMANHEAGYFIRVWPEIKDQVRQMVSEDPRYLAIRAARALRKSKIGR